MMGRRKRRGSGDSARRDRPSLAPSLGALRPAADRDPSPQVLKALGLLRAGRSRAEVVTGTGLPLAFVSLLAEDLDPAQGSHGPDIASLRAARSRSRAHRRTVLALYFTLGALNLTMAIIAFVQQNATLATVAFGVALLLILDSHRRAKRFRRNR